MTDNANNYSVDAYLDAIRSALVEIAVEASDLLADNALDKEQREAIISDAYEQLALANA